MSVSSISFSATLPPFYTVNGYNTSFSNTNLSATGNLSVATVKDQSSGQNTSTISSSVVSNGLSYTSDSASLNGDQLTVHYTSSNAANSSQNSGEANALLNTNINGNGISFSPAQGTKSDNTVTILYDVNPNGTYTARIQGAATSRSNTQGDENLFLRGFSQVGNSISITYQVANGSLSSLTSLAHAQVPLQTTTSSVDTTVEKDSSAKLPSFSSNGINNVAELLANANGLDTNGTLNNALQTGLQTNTNTQNNANTASILAATLSPAVSIQPNTSVSVTDFVDTTLSAFPTASSAPPASAQSNDSNANSSFSNTQDNKSSTDTSNTNSSFASSGNSSSSPAATVGIYSAISNASASNIRGSGYNTVA